MANTRDLLHVIYALLTLLLRMYGAEVFRICDCVVITATVVTSFHYHYHYHQSTTTTIPHEFSKQTTRIKQALYLINNNTGVRLAASIM